MNHSSESPGSDLESERWSSTRGGRSLTSPSVFRTYAQQRTYLEDPDELRMTVASSRNSRQGDAQSLSNRDSQTSLVDQYSPPDDCIASPSLRNIHELRAAGHAVRFANEIGSLLDDIEPGSHLTMACCRSSLITLATRMQSEKFRHKFSEDSYCQRLFNSCSVLKDEICSVAFAAALVFLLSENAQIVMQTSRLVDDIPMESLQPALNCTRTLITIAKDRKTNASKAAQADIGEFNVSLTKTGLFGHPSTGSIHLQDVGIECIAQLMKRKKEIGGPDSLITASLACNVITIGNTAIVSNDSRSRYVCDRALFIVEAFNATIPPDAITNFWTPQILLKLSPILDIALQQQDQGDSSSSHLALKLCLDLTNNNTTGIEILGSRSLIAHLMNLIAANIRFEFGDCEPVSRQFSQREEMSHLDQLVLALGSMINLAESNEEVRSFVYDDQEDQFDSIAQCFMENRERLSGGRSGATVSQQIAFGYVAVLLVILAQHSSLQDRILAEHSQERICGLIEAGQEFIDHNIMIESSAEQSKGWFHLRERLQMVADSLNSTSDE